jgi:putative oxidoreductase
MRREWRGGTPAGRLDLVLLALRLFIGVAFVFHGYPKVEHLTTWADKTIPGLPQWLAATAALVEFGGGIAIALGVLTRIFAFFLACNMAVATFVVSIPRGDVFVSNTPGAHTFELSLLYLVLALALVLLGAGAYSVDALVQRRALRTRSRTGFVQTRG